MKKGKGGFNHCPRYAETGTPCYLEEPALNHCAARMETIPDERGKFKCMSKHEIQPYDHTKFKLIKLKKWFKLVSIDEEKEEKP